MRRPERCNTELRDWIAAPPLRRAGLRGPSPPPAAPAAKAEPAVSRVAIIGSCITRDLWPARDRNPPELLYISRTSLATLASPPVATPTLDAAPPGLTAFEHRAVVWDLHKRALPALIDYRPTHVIFDFIDERYDLLAVGDARANHTWELQTSGYLIQPPLDGARTIPRTSDEYEALWREGVAWLLEALRREPALRDAQLVLHRSQWAKTYRDLDGTLRDFPPVAHLLEGRDVEIAMQNAQLDRSQRLFVEAVEDLKVVAAEPELQVASAAHRWGLSPFHFIPQYYERVREQLAPLGVGFEPA
jgi:hypothetical protein